MLHLGLQLVAELLLDALQPEPGRAGGAGDTLLPLTEAGAGLGAAVLSVLSVLAVLLVLGTLLQHPSIQLAAAELSKPRLQPLGGNVLYFTQSPSSARVHILDQCVPIPGPATE